MLRAGDGAQSRKAGIEPVQCDGVRKPPETPPIESMACDATCKPSSAPFRVKVRVTAASIVERGVQFPIAVLKFDARMYPEGAAARALRALGLEVSHG